MNKASQYPFERNVLLLICFLGAIRSVLAFIGDFQDEQIHDDVYTDLGFTILFAWMLIRLLFGKPGNKTISVFFVGFIALLLIAFYSAGGLESDIEHNIYVGLILLSFTLNDRLPIIFASILILGVISSLILLEINLNMSETFTDKHGSDLNFILAALGTIGISFFAKNVFSKNREELRENGIQLKSKMMQLQAKTEELSIQKESLEAITLSLDSKVNSRTKALNNQKKRREKYLSITLNELSETYEKTIQTIENMHGMEDQEELQQLIIQSGEKLKLEMESLKGKLNGEA